MLALSGVLGAVHSTVNAYIADTTLNQELAGTQVMNVVIDSDLTNNGAGASLACAGTTSS